MFAWLDTDGHASAWFAAPPQGERELEIIVDHVDDEAGSRRKPRGWRGKSLRRLSFGDGSGSRLRPHRLRTQSSMSCSWQRHRTESASSMTSARTSAFSTRPAARRACIWWWRKPGHSPHSANGWRQAKAPSMSCTSPATAGTAARGLCSISRRSRVDRTQSVPDSSSRRTRRSGQRSRSFRPAAQPRAATARYQRTDVGQVQLLRKHTRRELLQDPDVRDDLTNCLLLPMPSGRGDR